MENLLCKLTIIPYREKRRRRTHGGGNTKTIQNLKNNSQPRVLKKAGITIAEHTSAHDACLGRRNYSDRLKRTQKGWQKHMSKLQSHYPSQQYI